MKILHIPHAYHPVLGGAEIICKRVGELLVASGHDVKVLTTNVGAVQAYYQLGIPPVSRADETIDGVVVQRLPFCNALYQMSGWLADHVPVQAVSNRITGRTLAALRGRMDLMIKTEISRYQPDVVMTMPHLVVNVQSVLAARRRVQFPLVMAPMLHEHDPNWDVPAMAEALASADAVTAMTTHEVERLTRSYGVPAEKIFLASVGIDAEPLHVETVSRPPRVVFLGRKARSKGVLDLIEAMCRVWPKHPDAELVLAGVRLPETSEIDARVSALPTAFRKQVTDIGIVDGEEKAALLRSARCLVLPSKTESFGMVILDAWSHGAPVILWDIPVFRSIVESEKSGLLADPAEGSDGLSRAIVRFLENPEEAARMGKDGHEQAVKTYSWSTVAESYLEAYRHAISHARVW